MPGPHMLMIVNPAAGNGATGRNWPDIRARARQRLGSFATHITNRVGDAQAAAQQAVADGIKLVVAVGGDGTFNEVVNGCLSGGDLQRLQQIRDGFALGFIPDGTGCDIAKTLRIPKSTAGAIEIIANGRPCAVDMGRLRYQGHDGRCKERFFHNVVSFGVGGEVVQQVSGTVKTFGPFAAFLIATLKTLVRYRPKRVTLTIDDRFLGNGWVWNVAIANGRYHGGGMLVAPEADMADGWFDVTLIGRLTLLDVALNLHRLYNGNLHSVKQVHHFRGRSIRSESPHPVLIEMDGEQPGTLPVQIDLLPGVLNIMRKS